MQFNYDFANTPPSSGGGKNFPVSPEGGWLVQITAEEMRPMKNGQGSQLVFALQGLEGAVNGQTAESRHNVHHQKQETVAIAYAEISAIGYATGVLAPGRTHLADTSLLFGKPFRVIVVQQANSQYTEIVGYRSADGRDPVKIANGSANVPTHGAPGGMNQPPQGGAPGGFGGQPMGQPQQGFGAPQGQPQGQPQGGFQGQPQGGQQQPQGGFQGQPQQGGFGGNPGQAPQGGAPQGQGGGFGNAAPPQGGGWGNPQQGQPQGGAPGWGQGGGQPGWGGQQG